MVSASKDAEAEGIMMAFILVPALWLLFVLVCGVLVLACGAIALYKVLTVLVRQVLG